jgi:hypothetical protein
LKNEHPDFEIVHEFRWLMPRGLEDARIMSFSVRLLVAPPGDM